jgi:hypothetical protein
MGIAGKRSKVGNLSGCDEGGCNSAAADLHGTVVHNLERRRNNELAIGLPRNFLQKPTLFANVYANCHQIDKQWQSRDSKKECSHSSGNQQ